MVVPHYETQVPGNNFRFRKDFQLRPVAVYPESTNTRFLRLSHPPTCSLPQFMEQRKRPHVEGSDTVYPKKRAALDSNGVPSHSNGVGHPDEPKDGDNLEVRVLPC